MDVDFTSNFRIGFSVLSANAGRINAALAFFIPFILAANYNLNHWYVHGAYFGDSAWFAFLYSNASFPEMENPPAFGGSFLSHHISPLFWVTTAVYQLLPGLPQPVYFSLLQGLWYGLVGISIYLLSAPLQVSLAIRLALAITGALNGVALGSMGFPHFEAAMPALLLLFFCLHTRAAPRIVAVVTLVAFLSVREDAGLHAFGLLFLVAVYFWLKGTTRPARQYGTLAGICLVYAIVALTVQYGLLPSDHNQAGHVYTGSPAYAHLNANLLLNRLTFYLTERQYIFIPLVAIWAYGLVKRDWLVLLGGLSVVPWVLFSIAAQSPQAAKLSSYYAVPLMMFLFWPVIAARLDPDPRYQRPRYRLQLGLCLVSILLYFGSDNLHDDNPLESMGFDYVTTLGPTEKALTAIQDIEPVLGRVVYDDAVSAHFVKSVTAREWHYYEAYDLDRAYDYDTLIYYRDSFMADTMDRIADNAELRFIYTIPDTSLVIATKERFPEGSLNLQVHSKRL